MIFFCKNKDYLMERSKEMVVLQKGILFLCTGNYYRSQMAEANKKAKPIIILIEDKIPKRHYKITQRIFLIGLAF